MTEATVRQIFDDRLQTEAGVRIVNQLEVEDSPELRRNIDTPGKQEITLLVVALGARNKNAMRQLLAMGANPNQRSSKGESPVALSAGADDVDFVRILMAAGGNPNLRNTRQEPVTFTAVSQRRWPNLAVLLENGADMNATDAGGNTILHDCAQLGEFGPIPAMIDRGANFLKTNQNGVTLGDLVMRSRVNPASPQGVAREKVRELLRARGGLR